MTTVGILLISTSKYNKFIDATITGIKKYFFPLNDKTIYLHTDSSDEHDAVIIPIKHEPWPYITLKKFHTFVENSKNYTTEYLLSIDIDVVIQEYVYDSILNNLLAVHHSGHYKQVGTVETRVESTAYIDLTSKHSYVAGGFLGGGKDQFLEMCEKIKKNIDIDLDNNIIAKWHDESHFNKYLFENIDKFLILEPEYMTFGSDKPSKTYLKYHNNNNIYKAKIIALQNSQKGFNKFL